MKGISSPDATTKSAGYWISQDVRLTAKILHPTCSAFLGVAHPVSSARDAVEILGYRTVKTLALSIDLFFRFDPEKIPGFPVERLWNR